MQGCSSLTEGGSFGAAGGALALAAAQRALDGIAVGRLGLLWHCYTSQCPHCLFPISLYMHQVGMGQVMPAQQDSPQGVDEAPLPPQ